MSRAPFEDYARSRQSRERAGAEKLLSKNRFRAFDRCYGFVADLLLGQKAAKVLDYGCGSGDLLLWLASRSEVYGAELHGYDVSSSQLAALRDRDSSQRLVLHKDASSVEDAYAWVFCSHVIEHVPDPQLPAFMQDLCSKVSRDGGRLVIATPNGLNPFAHAYYMSMDATHVRMHSPFTLADLLDREGFEIERVARETPQVYDLMTLLKFSLWVLSVPILKLALLTTAGGVRGLGQPLILAPTFYVVARPRISRAH